MPHPRLRGAQALHLVGAATLAALLSTSALAQPNLTGAPTATRPISQPNLPTAAALAPRGGLLPSGSYRLSIDLPANGRAPAHTASDAVTVTHAGSSLNIAVTGGSLGAGQTFTGTLDASGAMTVSLGQGGATLQLSGTATAASASGDVVVSAPGVSEPPHGTFELTPPGQPQIRARPGGLIEAIGNLLHAIGCWAHGGGGC